MLIGLFGTGRNGSSLIHRLLDGLQDTYVHPVEEIFLTVFNDLSCNGRVSRHTRQNCTRKPLTYLNKKIGLQLLTTFYSDNLKTLHSEYILKCEKTKNIPAVTLSELLKKPEYDAAVFISDYLKAIGEHVRPDIKFKHQLFKSIETPYIDDYAGIFPDMRFIHILRHPVSVCSSQKRSLMENKGLPAAYIGYDWLVCMLDKRWIPHAESILAHRNDPRHITVLYEALVKNPVQEIARIANWLGLIPPPRPDKQTLFYNLDFTSFSFNPSKKGIEMPDRVIADLQKKYNYEEILTEREIDLINFKTGTYLSDFGYDRTSVPGRLDLMLNSLPVDKWELLNCKNYVQILKGLFGMFCRRAYVLRK